ncbi:hypothetical protein J3Q64DRAFT_1853001 [Phycomyces blakesleeanus]|uniref:Smr domain-containing protein n=2 Tax=Phycomyces blakesleeanus TaxID=4837 RepID=A0A167M2I7_PHYB8|nr:hypothetical protein PHYBLDRAFT_79725 [Phycomyces blakesleeanus NRRL 1555(-)]OAD71579.1 hypothetical protein PHYBLDRAFT_79725 [Phycomyces blakesleeanus NRRL 1555(-)]|eukprot:XP_018289619.1 hypothetical protein PHYBLDRAFT_79725 [Phycomyces blakesleeanus NRRL 1555(-)]
MGLLKDEQYEKATRGFERRQMDVCEDINRLKADFCPTLDPSLVEAIWVDTNDYSQAVDILSELSKESSVQSTFEAQSSPKQPYAPSIQSSRPCLIRPKSPTESDDSDGLSDENEEYEYYEDEEDQEKKKTEHSEEEVGDDFRELENSVDFLQMCFPDHERSDLLDALLTHDNDTEKTTDFLLTTEYLKDSSSNDPMSSVSTPTEHPRKKKKKKKPKIVWASGGHLTPSVHTRELDNNGMACVSDNHWHKYDATLGALQPLFPQLSHHDLLMAAQKRPNDLIAMIRYLMDRHRDLDPRRYLSSDELHDLEQIQKALLEIMGSGNMNEREILSIGLGILSKDENSTCEEKIQEAIEYCLTKEQREAKRLDNERLKLARQMEHMTVVSNSGSKNQKELTKDLPVVPEYLLLNNREYIEDDPEECRTMAMDLILQRNELFRKAGAAYQQAKNKNTGEGGIAFYYSDEARQLDSRAKNWNMRAARSLVRHQRLAHEDDHLLDLHGLTVAEAQVLIQEGVTQWWSRSNMQSGRRQIKPLKIVTGVGKHSLDGQSKLLPTALKWLKREGWQVVQSSPGCILVKGSTK